MVVAEAVAELETERVPFCFQLLAGFVQLLPALRELLKADLGKPVAAPVHQLPDRAERDRFPFPVDDRHFPRGGVPAALLFSHLLGDVADVGVFLVVEERDQDQVHRDVGAGPGLADRGDARRAAPDTDNLVDDLDAGLLLVGRGEHILHVLVEWRNERAFVEQRDRLAGGAGPGGGQRNAAAAPAAAIFRKPRRFVR